MFGLIFGCLSLNLLATTISSGYLDIRTPKPKATPLTYHVSDLPQGLSVAATTGIITGQIAQEDEYPVEFTVSNPLGQLPKIL